MKDELDDKDLIAFVMTNAALNHKPKDSEELFSVRIWTQLIKIPITINAIILFFGAEFKLSLI